MCTRKATKVLGLNAPDRRERGINGIKTEAVVVAWWEEERSDDGDHK
jgi:hypothetical protein